MSAHPLRPMTLPGAFEPRAFAAVSSKAIMLAGYSFFVGLTKKKLIDVIMILRDEYTTAQARINKLKGDIIKLGLSGFPNENFPNFHQLAAVGRLSCATARDPAECGQSVDWCA